MFRIAREIKFCFGHRLVDYPGKCRNLHGHNGRVSLTVESKKLNPLGMVVDFADINRTMTRWIDENFDHKTILHKDDPLYGRLVDLGEPVFALEDNPTTENIAKKIFYTARELGIPVSEATLWENDASSASYSEEGVLLNSESEGEAQHSETRGSQARTTVSSQPNTLFGSTGAFFVTREFKFCFGHRLQDYQGKCRQLHGHNGRLLVTVVADELDDMGMAADFGVLKRGVHRWIDNEWDHSMILEHGDPLIRSLEEFDCQVVVLNGKPTTENLARNVFSRASMEGLNVASVQLWETDACSAGFAPVAIPSVV